MSLEIERKFLVKGNDYRNAAVPVVYRQGYLAIFSNREIRVRIAGEKSFITVKSKVDDTTRHEFEYAIPLEDAEFMLDNLCGGSVIGKRRYRIPQGMLCWEVDEFLGDNEGLVVAEIELPHADFPFEKPAWVGEEISGDDRYLNAALSLNPYKNWKNE